MTCKDCKLYRECNEPNKSVDYDTDGDSWANWCDDFENKRKGNAVEYKGYTAIQTNYNWHISILNADGKLAMHISANKRYSKWRLRKAIKVLMKLRGEKE